jgi:chromatin remodeling complex protein RSC6
MPIHKRAAKKKAAKPSPWPKKKAAAKKVVKKAAPKKAAKKAAAPKKAALKKKVAPKKAAKKTATKRASSNTGFNAPLTASPALADVIGSNPMARTEIIKKIWEYIRKNNLQDKTNRRMINADAKLKALFSGKDQVSMFDLAKIVSSNVK